MDIRIVSVEPSMIQQIVTIEQASFTCPWSLKSFEEAIASDTTTVLTALDKNDRVCGFTCVTAILEEGEILNIAVEPSLRRFGIGRKLLGAAVDTAKRNGVKALYLEVRRSNMPAIGLYESFGFTQIGIRKNYYTDPTEDAILMMLTLN